MEKSLYQALEHKQAHVSHQKVYKHDIKTYFNQVKSVVNK